MLPILPQMKGIIQLGRMGVEFVPLLQSSPGPIWEGTGTLEQSSLLTTQTGVIGLRSRWDTLPHSIQLLATGSQVEGSCLLRPIHFSCWDPRLGRNEAVTVPYTYPRPRSLQFGRGIESSGDGKASD